MPHELPSLKDLDLFADICTELRAVNQPLKDVAHRLGKAPSTVSECIKSLEKHYSPLELITKGRFPKPTKEGEKILEMFNKIVEITRGIDGNGTATRHEIRVISTRSLLNRLLPGPVSAFMMWLKLTDSKESARVVTTACDHNELLSRLTERGINSYHWGLCWKLPQVNAHSYLNFSDIPIVEGGKSPKPCSTPIVAITSDLEYGLQGEELKKLFRTKESIPAEKLWNCLDTETTAVVNTEPEDDLRTGLMNHVNPSRTIAVHQYEEGLFQVRSMDAGLTFGPGWYQYRNHVEARTVLLNGSEHRRSVQVFVRKSMTDGIGLETQLKDLPRPVIAFYVILRLFLGERREEYLFSEFLFADTPPEHLDHDAVKWKRTAARKTNRQAPAGARGPGYRLDPANDEITPAKINEWIRENQGEIEKLIQSVQRGRSI